MWKSGGLGKRVPFCFSRFSSSPSPGLLRLPYRLLSSRNTASLYTTRFLSLKILDQFYSSISKTSRKQQMFTADIGINNSSRRIQHKIRTVPNYINPSLLAGFMKLAQRAKNLIELILFHTRTRLKPWASELYYQPRFRKWDRAPRRTSSLFLGNSLILSVCTYNFRKCSRTCRAPVMQQKLPVFHKSFFTGKIARKFTGPM